MYMRHARIMIICMRSKSSGLFIGSSLSLSLSLITRVPMLIRKGQRVRESGRVGEWEMREGASMTRIGFVPKCRMRHDTVNPIEAIWVNFKSSKQLV
jgi:hypothetical protein